jgi:glycosyltransferase involved in cell wall biosynthesis
MKICFFCNSIFSFGGVQRVMAVIAKEMAKSNEVCILTLDNPSLAENDLYELSKNHIKVVFFQFERTSKLTDLTHKPYSWFYKKNQLNSSWSSSIYARSSFPKVQRAKLIETLNKIDADIIIGVHAFLSIKLATVRRQLRAKKVIGWMHNSYTAFFEKEPAYLDGLKWHFKYQMKKLDEVIVLTKTDAALFKDKLGLETSVIYNPLTLVPGNRCDVTAKKFLAVGRMSPQHKGFDILINAFALFAKDNKEWTLDIVGDGPEHDMLQNLIIRYQLQDRITIHPFTQDIQSYYSEVSVFVLSSRWEGFPLVIMEALAHGLPIIASDIPVCKEFLSGKDFCRFFESENTESLYKALSEFAKSCELEILSDKALDFSKSHNTLHEIMNQWNKLI